MGQALGIASIGMGIFQMGQAGQEAAALRARGEYQQQMFNLNAEQAEEQGREAIRLGNEQSTKYMEKVRSTTSKQVASYAGQGVSVNTGVAAKVTSETAAKGVQDVLTIKDNAWRTAWGYKQEAANLRRQGQFARMGGNASASSTLATGGLNFAGTVLNSYKFFKDA